MTQSVQPGTAETVEEILRQGIQWFRNEDWVRALGCFDAVARLRPHRNDVHNHRARAFERLGQAENALECLDRALAIDPHNVADLRNRAITLAKLRRPAQALEAYETYLARRPEDTDALAKRGLLLNELDRRQEALASIDAALRLAPNDLDVLNARVTVLDNLERYTDALAGVDRMLGLDPTYLHAINNAGLLLARLGRFNEALRCYERSLAVQPDQPQARYNRALIRLALGDWIRGFQEFESRWETESLARARPSGIGPLWHGQDLKGKTLLLYHEQGYGDTLQCARYIPLLAEKGACVLLAVPAALSSLLSTVPGVARVSTEHEPLPAHDYQSPLMSLPLAFRTTPDTIPAATPYVRSDPARVAEWARTLGERTRPRIGLVWGGRRYAAINYPRDLPVPLLQPLLDMDAQFISLQKDVAESDRPLLAQWPQLRLLGDTLRDFADTAALIENLDLVIAVDTAVAHLAGALGKPVWLLNRHASCWRWLQTGTDSAWYPTLRQFRQPSVGDWRSVIGTVRHALTHFLNGEREPQTPVPPRPLSRPREKIRFVCATRLSSQEFFKSAPLGRSLPVYQSFPRNQTIELRLFPENRTGLPHLYNTAIEEARADPAVLVFIHDDVYLSDYYWSDHLHRSLRRFDLVGLVGNRRRVPGQVSWMFLDENFTTDNYDNFSGVLGHGQPFPDLRQLSVYGKPGLEVKLLDGVLLAIHSRTLIERELRFDPRFQFHFYDMDFCRQAELRQVRMGTCAMSVVHASAGELGNEGWRAAYGDYIAKYAGG
jgi:tetratricopeptide (TPR) repeat protein